MGSRVTRYVITTSRLTFNELPDHTHLYLEYLLTVLLMIFSRLPHAHCCLFHMGRPQLLLEIYAAIPVSRDVRNSNRIGQWCDRNYKYHDSPDSPVFGQFHGFNVAPGFRLRTRRRPPVFSMDLERQQENIDTYERSYCSLGLCGVDMFNRIGEHCVSCMTLQPAVNSLTTIRAFNAIVSLQIMALAGTYEISLLALMWRRLYGKRLPPAPWSLGRWGLAINVCGFLVSKL